MAQAKTVAAEAVTGGALREFTADLRGNVLSPADAGYDEARKVWNGMIDKRPGLIARCMDASDVVKAVDFARANDLLVALKGGGHSFPGHSVCDGGLMIDMSLMKGMTVDPQARTATADPGLTWEDFDRAANAHGLGTTGGLVSHTGIAGLTLGGGIGWLGRNFGLTCDNVLSIDLVTADGQSITTSASQNEDLFWGLRGGGGNFGVATSFTYQLHPVDQVMAGLVAHPLSKAKETLRFYRSYAEAGPDELTTAVALLTNPDGDLVVGIAVCHSGSIQEGERVVRPVKEYGPPVMDHVEPMPYPVFQKSLDGTSPHGRRYYLKSHMLNNIDDGAIDALVDHFAIVPSPDTLVLLFQLGGAIDQVPTERTAYHQRGAAYRLAIVSGWDDPADDDVNIAWARECDRAMQQFVSGGVYVNELGDEGQDRILAAYGRTTYDRLVGLKDRYDPTNFFRLNQNIAPRG